MATKERYMEELFWHQFSKDYPSDTDLFAPAATAMQEQFGVGSKDVLRTMGEGFGRKAAEKLTGKTLADRLSELSAMWRRLGLGQLEILSKDPLTIGVSGCTLCGGYGQGSQFDCSFHEGFLQGVLSSTLGVDVQVSQGAPSPGEPATWCRKFSANVRV